MIIRRETPHFAESVQQLNQLLPVPRVNAVLNQVATGLWELYEYDHETAGFLLQLDVPGLLPIARTGDSFYCLKPTRIVPLPPNLRQTTIFDWCNDEALTREITTGIDADVYLQHVKGNARANAWDLLELAERTNNLLLEYQVREEYRNELETQYDE